MATLSAREGAIKILEETDKPDKTMTLAEIRDEDEWKRRGWGKPLAPKSFSGCLSKAPEIESIYDCNSNEWKWKLT